MTLRPDILVGQFILCRSADQVPEDWPMRRHGNWFLGSHPSLPVVEILGADASVIGWLLGHAIGPESGLITDTVRFPVTPSASDAAAQFESALYGHGGRFAAVGFLPQSSRFYLDPCGSLATIFCPRQGIAASTTTLVPYAEGCEDDTELIRAMGIPHKETCWCPFGLTSRRLVHRLLPNHFLDLETWNAVRHWPTGEIETDPDVQGAVREVASILKTSISALARVHLLHMSLTAGRDTRMMLACSRDHLSRIQFFTVTAFNEVGRLDVQNAPKIAKRFGLDHVILPYEPLSEAGMHEWVYRTGGCISGVITGQVPPYMKLDGRRAVLWGAAGDIARGFHWRKGDAESSPVSAEDLLKRREIPAIGQVRERARQWIEGLPVKSALTIWGLLYNEEFTGCYCGPALYGLIRSGFCVFPFSHRRILKRLLSLPSEYRRQLRFEVDLVGSQWPELLDFPFNWPMGIRKYVHALKWRAEAAHRSLAALLGRAR